MIIHAPGGDILVAIAYSRPRAMTMQAPCAPATLADISVKRRNAVQIA